MTRSFKMPDPGEGVHEVEIIEVYVSKGDEVSDGDKLLAVETDKAGIDIPATFDGRIESVEVAGGDRVEVGDVLLAYTPAGGDEQHDGKSRAEQRKPAERELKPGKKAKQSKRKRKEADDEAASGRGGQSSAKRKAGSRREDAQTGKGKRKEKRKDKGTRKAEAGSAAEPARREGQREGPVRATPSTRRLARELSVELRSVEGSGPGGRVLTRDVEAAAEKGGGDRKRSGAGPRREAPAIRSVETAGSERTERQPLRGVRRAVAERMSAAWAEIPHVTHEELVDITALEEFRRDNKARVEEAGGKLTITILVLKALAATLRAFPRFNASLDSDAQEIVLKRDCHIGIAVDTDDGLLVPVLRDVDRKSVLETAVDARELSERARRRELEREEMTGATFTLTNSGGIGGTRFTPIINPPQAAILGLGRVQLVPTVQGDLERYEIEPRLMLPLLLSYDHRLNDGADAARFVNHLAETLVDPASFVLQA